MEEQISTIDGVAPAALEVEINQEWLRLRSDPDYRADAAEEGVDLAEIDRLGDNPFVVEHPGNRMVVAEAILVKIAVNVGTTITLAVLHQVWTRLIKPAIDKAGRNIADTPKP